jgi:hypothetical protein
MKLLGTAGLWFRLAHGDGAAVLLGAAALVLTAILGLVWLSGARAARRFNAAVDGYPEREIERERHGKEPQKARGVFTPRGALPKGSTSRW